MTRAGRVVALVAVLFAGCRSRSPEQVLESRTPTPETRAPEAIQAHSGPLWVNAAEAASGAGSTAKAPAPSLVWIEAEQPVATDFPAHHPFEADDDVQRGRLSGGAWIGVYDPNKRLFLEYDVSVPTANSFDFYVRKFWKHGPFRWRFDHDEWQQCSRDAALLDSATIRPEVAANWVSLGQVKLAAGTHRLRVELTESMGAAAFDAFVLSSGGFTPRGKLRPSEPFPPAPAGWFTFDPPADTFQPSAIDLRYLNQARSGDEGFVRPRGSELVFEKTGTPVRFWGVNIGPEALYLPQGDLRRMARHFAKFGVNLVRLQAATFDEDSFRKNDDQRLAGLQLLASELRNQGIYLGLSLYFPLKLHPGPKDGFDGYKGQNPFGLAYFNEQFEAVERTWWRHILAKVNPHTGLKLADDPALAYIELVNEDSTLFWTFNPYAVIPAEQTALLEHKFFAWLATKYGSAQAALAAWQSQPIKGDALASERVGVVGPWALANQHTLRSRDTAEFLTKLMRNHYASLQDWIRKELGYKGMTVCSNWHTADENVLGPLDNWANAVCDVMDRHAYMDGPHDGDAASYSIRKGQKFDDQSVLRSPPKATADWAALPAFIEPRYNDKPAFVSEIGWPAPNRFRSEGPLLVAAYGRSTGMDAPMWFAAKVSGWSGELSKFEVSDPVTLGQFPAAALVFRRGLVAEPQATFTARMSDAQLWALNGAPVSPVTGLDATRAADGPAGSAARAAGVSPLSMLVGPVDVQLGGDGPLTQAPLSVDLTQWIDRERHTISNRSGEIVWDFEVGQVTVRAPAFNAAVGFFKGAVTVDLPHVQIALKNDYASIALVALDGRALADSNKMLLQVMTEVSNSGWSAPGQGLREILDPGHGPLLVKAIEGSVRLKRADAAGLRVVALDAAGQVAQRALRGADEILLLPDVVYYLLESGKHE